MPRTSVAGAIAGRQLATIGASGGAASSTATPGKKTLRFDHVSNDGSDEVRHLKAYEVYSGSELAAQIQHLKEAKVDPVLMVPEESVSVYFLGIIMFRLYKESAE